MTLYADRVQRIITRHHWNNMLELSVTIDYIGFRKQATQVAHSALTFSCSSYPS